MLERHFRESKNVFSFQGFLVRWKIPPCFFPIKLIVFHLEHRIFIIKVPLDRWNKLEINLA